MQISSNVRDPSHNSQSRLFMSSNGRRSSLGARIILASNPSNLLNFLGCLITMNRPVTPSKSGCGPAAPRRPHHTGSRTGKEPSNSSKLTPHKSKVHVHTTKEIIHAIPENALRRTNSSLSVKLRRYHVATPSIEQMDSNNHHAPGILAAVTSPSRHCR